MSCLGRKAPNCGGPVFCFLTALLLALMLAITAFGLLHVSDQPRVLGRYSVSYAVLLTGLIAVTAWLGWVLLAGGPRVTRCTANLYTLLVSTLLMLLVVEWALRAFNPFGVDFFHNLPYHMQGMVDDSRLGYRHPESAEYMLGEKRVRINSHGLRDDEVPYAKTEGQKRILVLGDSVTFGWGVSQGESFSDRLEVLLREQTGGRDWQVINAGVNGYNTRQEADFLRIEGMRYSPDYLVLVYVSNDVEPVFDPNVTTWRRHPEWPASLPEGLNRLRQQSYLFQLTKLFTRMQQMDEARSMAEAGNQTASRKVRSMTGHPRWPDSRSALLDIAQQCRDAGIPLLVGLYSSLDGGHDPAFIADLQEAGIDAVHLQPAWEGVPESLAHVSRIDSHPSALVHEKLAEYLANLFRQRGWLNES